MYLEVYNSNKELVNTMTQGIAEAFLNDLWAKATGSKNVKRFKVNNHYDGTCTVFVLEPTYNYMYVYYDVPCEAGFINAKKILREYVRQSNNIAGGL